MNAVLQDLHGGNIGLQAYQGTILFLHGGKICTLTLVNAVQKLRRISGHFFHVTLERTTTHVGRSV